MYGFEKERPEEVVSITTYHSMLQCSETFDYPLLTTLSRVGQDALEPTQSSQDYPFCCITRMEYYITKIACARIA